MKVGINIKAKDSSSIPLPKNVIRNAGKKSIHLRAEELAHSLLPTALLPKYDIL